MSDEIDVGLLEPLLRDWVQLIGVNATLAIVEKHGGTLLNIPMKAGENADLVALVGAEKAAILGRHYGKERPLVPKALDALRAARDQAIRSQRKHKSMRQLAREYGLGERRIRQITSGEASPGGDLPSHQNRLFD